VTLRNAGRGRRRRFAGPALSFFPQRVWRRDCPRRGGLTLPSERLSAGSKPHSQRQRMVRWWWR
jgi:hypothetical protein